MKDQDLSRVASFPVEIVSDHPQAFFSATKTGIAVDKKEEALGSHHFLWVAADDADGAGVDRLIFRIRVEGGDRVILEVEATDLVGNVSKKEVVMREDSKDRKDEKDSKDSRGTKGE